MKSRPLGGTCHVLRMASLSFSLFFSHSLFAGNDIEIVSGNALVNMGSGYVSTDDSAQIGIYDLYPDSPSVYRSVTTGSAGANTQEGNILLSGDVDFNRSNVNGPGTLRLNALNNIVLDGRLYDGLGFNDRFNLYLNPDSDAQGGGAAYLNSSIGRGLRTTVDGNLVIGGTGAYNLTDINDGLSADSIDNSLGGSFSFTAGSLTLNNSNLSIDTGGLLGSSVALSASKFLSVGNSNVVSLGAGSSLVVSGGSLTAGQIDNSAGGAFGFTSGILGLGNSGLAIDASGLLGNAVSLDSAKVLSVSDVINVGATGNLDLNGGQLSAASIENSAGGTFVFNSGSLSLTNSNVTVGTSGLMGNSLALTSDKRLYMNNNQLIIDASGSVSLDGGYLRAESVDNSAGGTFSFNSGDLELANSNLVVGSGGLFSNLALSTGKKVFLLNDNALVIGSGSSVTLDGGSLTVGSINNTVGGSFAFNAGSLLFTGSSVNIDEAGVLGNTLAMDGGKYLQVASMIVGNGSGNNDVINQTGGTVNIRPSGTMVVDAGGVYNISGGTLDLDNSNGMMVNGHVFQTGGQVFGTKVLGDSSIPLVLGAGGLYELNGGTLVASSIDRTAGGDFLFTSGTLFTSENIDVNTAGLLGDTINLTAGTKLTAGAMILSNSGSVELNGGTLDVTNIDNSAGGTFTYLAGDLVTGNSVTINSGGLLGPAVTVGAGDSLELGGLAVASGGSLIVDGGTVDAATMSRSGGTVNFNSGTLSMGNTFYVSSGGLLGSNVSLTSGKVLNANSGMTIGSGSSFTLNGGALSVGPVSGAGSFAFNSGSLETVGQNLTIDTGGLLGQNLTLSSGKSLRVSQQSGTGLGGGLTIAVAGAITVDNGFLRARSLTNNNSLTLANNGYVNVESVVNNGTISVTDSSLLQTGGTYSGGRVTENRGNINTSGTSTVRVLDGLLDNYGSVVVGAGTTMEVADSSNVGGAEYIQYSGSTVVDGVLNVDGAVKINGGTLSGSGVLNADLVINPDGTLTPGNSPGALEVNGDFTLASGATMVMEIESDGAGGYLFDQLFVTGNYDLQGQVRFSLLSGVDETIFQNVFSVGDFFQAGTSASGTAITDTTLFDGVELLAANGDSWFSIGFKPDGSFAATPTTAPVPVPATVWLFGSGLIGLLGMARRKAS